VREDSACNSGACRFHIRVIIRAKLKRALPIGHQGLAHIHVIGFRELGQYILGFFSYIGAVYMRIFACQFQKPLHQRLFLCSGCGHCSYYLAKVPSVAGLYTVEDSIKRYSCIHVFTLHEMGCQGVRHGKAVG